MAKTADNEEVREVRRFKKELPCQLTQAEKIAFGEECARKTQDYSDLEEQAKAAADEVKVQKQALKADISRAARIVNSGYEHRQVDCEQAFEFKEGIARTVRTDTGEIIHERPLTAEEMQTALPLMPDTRFERIDPHDKE